MNERLTADAQPLAAQKASAAQVGRAVFWSFVGIRKASGYEDDVAKITPMQAIVAGLIGAAIFVASLVMLVKFLTR